MQSFLATVTLNNHQKAFEPLCSANNTLEAIKMYNV
jgi:hypothetical protein